MTYDYLTINYASVSGFIFLLIFLYANASLAPRIKQIFYLLILLEFVEMLTYSLELWTTTFATLSPMRLWLSAIGYAIRPWIFCLMLMLAMRNTETQRSQRFPRVFYLPAIVNMAAAFSVFFTDIVYSYTPDNQFHRGPLGYITYLTVILYLVILMIAVFRSHADRPKLEVLIIFAICLLLLFSMAVEALYAIRTVNRTSIIMVTIFYYMFFQTQFHHVTISKEKAIRTQLEQANKLDGTTGVLTKTAFADAAKALLLPDNAQHLTSVGFVFLDLDHLKDLNDTLGHVMGDIAIADTARAIQNMCRKTDLIGRFGGDEFCVMLSNISKQRFYMFLNEVQARLQNEYTADGLTIAVSASIGAVYTEQVDKLRYEQLIQMADEALYQAKSSGRNCHIVREK